MNYTALTRIALFGGIDEEGIEKLLSEFGVTETHFRRGDILARQDEPCNRLTIMLTGAAKGEMTDPSGKVVKVEDIQAPNPLAILFLFGPDSRFPAQATATEDGTAIVIPRQMVLRMLSRNETLLRNYLDISAGFAARLSRKLHLMSFRTIRQKLAMYLFELAQTEAARPIGSAVTVRLDRTHLALAEYFGVSRQALERELKSMAAEGLVHISGKDITLPERRALANLVKF